MNSAPRSDRFVKVLVEFAGDLDVGQWAERHGRGEVPDRTPFGLHKMADATTGVAFRVPTRNQPLRTLARKVQGRCDGWDVVGQGMRRISPSRLHADVVLCMDERAGLPAALAKVRTPVVSGIAWIDRPEPGARAAITRRALHRLDAIFSHASAHLDSLAQGWDLDRERMHLITVGIDTDHFAQADYPDDPTTVFSVGDDRFRDFPTLIRAVGQLRERRLPVNLELATTLPVAMPDEYGTVYRHRVDGVVRSHIAAAGVVAVANATNLVGSGLTTILQAMAVGRPVVISDCPGIGEYIVDGVTGILVPPGDEAAMADALASLIADPDRARAMGEAGARHVRERFTSVQAAVQLRELARTVACA